MARRSAPYSPPHNDDARSPADYETNDYADSGRPADWPGHNEPARLMPHGQEEGFTASGAGDVGAGDGDEPASEHWAEWTRQWHHVRRELRHELGDATFDSWLRPLDLISVNGQSVMLSVPTKFMRDWIEKNYIDAVKAHWANANPAIGEIEIMLNGRALPPAGPRETPPPAAFPRSTPHGYDTPFGPSGQVSLSGQPRATVVQEGGHDHGQERAASANAPAQQAPRGAPAASAHHPQARPVNGGMPDGMAQTPQQKPAAAASPATDEDGFGSPGEDNGTPGRLEQKYTFDQFVVGKSNELAHAAARRVAESDGGVPFNPLFLHGGTGLGKTHLMHAIAWEIRKRNPDRKVLCLSAEKFMYRFVAAIRHHSQLAFKEQFRNVDVLMIDDFQFLGGKTTTQEEFFHTFNTLVDRNRQVIISADRSPSDLENIEDRIRSRLSWGLVADIHPTDYELRLGILQTKARQASEIYGEVEIPKNVLEFLAHKITSNVRELEGALHRILAHASLVGRAVNLEMAHEVLRPLIRANARKVTVEEIQRRVSDYFEIKHQDMLSPRRSRVLARPRQIAMYLSKQLTTRSLPDIGRRFGNRDHTTVMHAVRKIEELRQSDPGIDEAVENLRRLLES